MRRPPQFVGEPDRFRRTLQLFKPDALEVPMATTITIRQVLVVVALALALGSLVMTANIPLLSLAVILLAIAALVP